MCMRARSGPKALQSIPGVGAALSADLNDIGIHAVADLVGKDPETLYRKLIRLRGAHVDRCVLYVFRCAVYFAEHTHHDPEKLTWWHWKDER